MFYPNHHIRSYCLYLGSLDIRGDQVDLGVYEAPDGSVSHAIVFGKEDWEYLSGDIDLTGRYYSHGGLLSKVNQLAYEDHLRIKEKENDRSIRA